MTAYLRPTAPIAADVIVTGDPGLAMELAQRVLVKPLMANHHHGLWGYSGITPAGRELTVQSGGIGAPSTAAVVAELVDHGARRLVRVAGCAALDPSLGSAEPVLVVSALGADGTTAALGAELTGPDDELTGALRAAAPDALRELAIVSFDLGAGAEPALRERWIEAGIGAVDRETAALFAVAAQLGVVAAAALVVTETATRADADEATGTTALLELGGLAGSALALGAEVVAG